jgi:hypothetical protein
MAGLNKDVPPPTAMWRHFRKRMEETGASRELPKGKA